MKSKSVKKIIKEEEKNKPKSKGKNPFKGATKKLNPRFLDRLEDEEFL